MFGKKKNIPAPSRSRFIKVKPKVKIGPKETSSEKCEKTPVSNGDNSEENKDHSALSAVAAPDKINEESCSNETLSTIKSSSCESNVDFNQNIFVSDSTVERESLTSDSKTVDKALIEDSAIQSESLFLTEEIRNDPVEETERYPIGEDSFENNDNSSSGCSSGNVLSEDIGTSFEAEYISPDKSQEQISKNVDLSDKSSLVSSPVKTAFGSTTDKSLRFPCITKLLAGPKKRALNREIHERKKKLAGLKELPPRSQMTFTDLIYWNPQTSPMKSKPIENKTVVVFDPKEKESLSEEEENVDGENENSEGSLAPKLFVNENGEIVIDESSLVVKRKRAAVDMTSEAINMDDDSNITYGSFRRKVTKQWTARETINFYKALSVIGADFALMENIMPNRTRRELKIKFKKEEKLNTNLLRRAMYETETFQSTLSPKDLNFDIIDIPGLEEKFTDRTTTKKGQKPESQKANQSLSDSIDPAIPNDENHINQNGDTVPVKKKRGRPKKNPNADPFDIINKNKKKYVDDSPLVRKRKLRILSEDSMDLSDPDTNGELCEIQVQINTVTDNGEEEQLFEETLSPPMKKKRGRPKKSDVSNAHLMKIDLLRVRKENITYCSKSTEKSSTTYNDNIQVQSSTNPEESPTINNDASRSPPGSPENNPILRTMINGECTENSGDSVTHNSGLATAVNGENREHLSDSVELNKNRLHQTRTPLNGDSARGLANVVESSQSESEIGIGSYVSPQITNGNHLENRLTGEGLSNVIVEEITIINDFPQLKNSVNHSENMSLSETVIKEEQSSNVVLNSPVYTPDIVVLNDLSLQKTNGDDCSKKSPLTGTAIKTETSVTNDVSTDAHSPEGRTRNSDSSVVSESGSVNKTAGAKPETIAFKQPAACPDKPYRRTRNPKVKPNIKQLPVRKPEEAKNMVETNVSSEAGALNVVNLEEPVVLLCPSSLGTLEVVNITDNQLLPASVTDVVTSAPVKSRRQRTRPNILAKKKDNDCSSGIYRPQPSSLNYTPVLENNTTVTEPCASNKRISPRTSSMANKSKSEITSVDTVAEPYPSDTSICPPSTSNKSDVLTSKSNQSNANHIDSGGSSVIKREPPPLSSLPVPAITPERASKSSPLFTSLNVSSNKTISIPMTPDRTDISEPKTDVLFFTKSPSGNNFHFYAMKNFSGGKTLPPEIKLPPVCNIKKENDKA